jgi:hypothetical protein
MGQYLIRDHNFGQRESRLLLKHHKQWFEEEFSKLVHRRKQATHKPSLTLPFLQVAVNTSRCPFDIAARSCKHFTLRAKTLPGPLNAQTRVRAHVSRYWICGAKSGTNTGLFSESFVFLTNTNLLLLNFHSFFIWGMVKNVDKFPLP